jgi:adenine phosphoribosyltransferase
LIVDDLLATGGTAEATCELVSKLKGKINGFVVLVELEFLKGRKKLNQYNVHSLVKY